MRKLSQIAYTLVAVCSLTTIANAQNALVFFAQETADAVVADSVVADSAVVAEGTLRPLDVPPAPGYTEERVVEEQQVVEEQVVQQQVVEERYAIDEVIAPVYGKAKGKHSWYSGLGVYSDFEIVMLRASRADGMQDANGNAAEFEHEIAPRVALGVIGASGLGVRTRYFDYSHAVNSTAGNRVGVDALTMDLEVFERLDLSCHTSLEWSAGVRYTDFQMRREAALEFDNSEGWGGTFGLQLNRCVLGGSMYTRARYSILHINDGHLGNGLELDMVRSQTEIGLGYEVTREMGGALLRFRSGYEWQQWDNFVMAEALDGPTDVGFDGFVFGLGVEY